MKIIDSHLHLFNLQQGNYHWLSPDHPPDWPNKNKLLHHNFDENNLTLNPPLSLAGFVHIEAGFDNTCPWKEIQWLEEHCKLPFRSIGFADLGGDFNETITCLGNYSSVVGIRNIIESDKNEVLLRTSTRKHLETLASKGWIFNIGFDLENTLITDCLCQLMTAIPELNVIIDHATLKIFYPVAHKNLSKLANLNRCFVKCSGWEMAEPEKIKKNLFFKKIKNSLLETIEIFGKNRIMLGSNFPVCLLAFSNFNHCWKTYTRFLHENILEKKTWNQLSYKNAKNLFGF